MAKGTYYNVRLIKVGARDARAACLRKGAPEQFLGKAIGWKVLLEARTSGALSICHSNPFFR